MSRHSCLLLRQRDCASLALTSRIWTVLPAAAVRARTLHSGNDRFDRMHDVAERIVEHRLAPSCCESVDRWEFVVHTGGEYQGIALPTVPLARVIDTLESVLRVLFTAEWTIVTSYECSSKTGRRR